MLFTWRVEERRVSPQCHVRAEVTSRGAPFFVCLTIYMGAFLRQKECVSRID